MNQTSSTKAAELDQAEQKQKRNHTNEKKMVLLRPVSNPRHVALRLPRRPTRPPPLELAHAPTLRPPPASLLASPRTPGPVPHPLRPPRMAPGSLRMARPHETPLRKHDPRRPRKVPPSHARALG